MPRTLAFLLSGVLFSGCAMNINLNANRFESPETRGHVLSTEIDAAALTGSNTLLIVPDVTASPLQVNSPSLVRSNASYLVGGNMGILIASTSA